MPIIEKFDLTVSLVLYNTSLSEINHVTNLLRASVLKTKIYLIDNSPVNNVQKSIPCTEQVEYIFNNANVGYGRGHNVAIGKAFGEAKYHLVLNADVDFDPAILKKAFDYMEANTNVGLLSPQIKLPNGEMQYFCRLLPTPFDLFARRFLPQFLKPVFKNRLNNYLLLTKDYSKPMNIPNLPGCFMFMRADVLEKVGGFDESFFMYVEDVDLTRRIHEISATVYYPDIIIEHGLARGSYGLSKLTLYHINSALYYFNKWGWFNDKKRFKINASLLKELT
jgi:GT2 family glycosyltransferase